MTQQAKEFLAELLGTFTLCFIGIAAVITGGSLSPVVPALAHGLVLVGLIFAYGHISGAQFNPAVTVGLLVGGKIEPIKAGIYIVAQFVGGAMAAFVAYFLAGSPEGNFGATTGSLTTSNVWSAAAIEGILVFFLLTAIYQSAVYGKAGNNAALAIGLTLTALIAATGALTGASVNPARTLGPVLVSGDYTYFIQYFVGLFVGGAVAGAVHGHLLKS